MKKILLLITILPFAVSCFQTNEKSIEKDKNDQPKELMVDSIEKRNLRELPDENATTIIIDTKNRIDDKELISKLKVYFEKEKFKIEEIKFIEENSYSNCKENQIVRIKGKGIKKYYIKRQLQKQKNYYPDFMMWIYEFNNEEEARIAENEVLKAFESGNGYCNGKSPEYIVKYKNKIIHLGTRAEMFRGYIKTFADKIKKLT